MGLHERAARLVGAEDKSSVVVRVIDLKHSSPARVTQGRRQPSKASSSFAARKASDEGLAGCQRAGGVAGLLASGAWPRTCLAGAASFLGLGMLSAKRKDVKKQTQKKLAEPPEVCNKFPIQFCKMKTRLSEKRIRVLATAGCCACLLALTLPAAEPAGEKAPPPPPMREVTKK